MTAGVDVGTEAELVELLRDASGRVRLLGRGTRGDRLPTAAEDAQPVSLRRLDRIERLERDDLTCSVQPGVPTAALDAELAERGLELGFDDPDAGDGTIGGLYAADPLGPPNRGVACPRSTILGGEVVLGDGATCRSGARVVKSVAGFDVHKLLIGSRGRLFAATLLHLKLRPRAERRAWFESAPLPLDAALERFAALRRSTQPLRQLWVRRDERGVVVAGQLAGRGTQVDRALGALELTEVETAAPGRLPTTPPPDSELLIGVARPSRLAALLSQVPDATPFVAHGGGRFELCCPVAEGKRLLALLPPIEAFAEVAQCPPQPDRRGARSPEDQGALRLHEQLRAALDPGGRLA